MEESYAFDEELLGYLSHQNEWFRKQTINEIAWRNMTELVPKLKAMPLTLETLWALDALNAVEALPINHSDPYIRRWAWKMAGEKQILPPLGEEKHLEVCAQILASAKKLPSAGALFLLRAGDIEDESGHLPLLAWRALGAKAEKERETVFKYFNADPAFLQTKLFRDHLAEKLAKRYALAGGEENVNSCADLLALTNDEALRGKFIAGIASAFKGGEMPTLPEALQKALNDYMAKQSGGDLTLALRSGNAEALKNALKLLSDAKATNTARIAIAKTLAELGKNDAVMPMVAILKSSAAPSLKRGILQAAAKFDDKRIPEALLLGWEGQIAGDNALREDALRVMAGRKEWAQIYYRAVSQSVVAQVTPVSGEVDSASETDLQTDIPVKVSSVVGAGAKDSETVVVKFEGDSQLDLSSWQLKDEDGNTFKFPKLTLYPNGAVQVHTITGTDTVIDLYWGIGDAVWSSGENAQLFDDQGNLRAVYGVP